MPGGRYNARVLRWLLTFTCALSLLLCIAVIALWAASDRQIITCTFRRGESAPWEASIRQGSLILENESASKVRLLNTLRNQTELETQEVARLQAQWEKRPDRYERPWDDLDTRMSDARERESIDRGRYMNLLVNFTNEEARPTLLPPASHSIR